MKTNAGLPPVTFGQLVGRDMAAPGTPNDPPLAPTAVFTAVLIVTTNEIAGYRIEEVHGDVFGLTVRARNAFSNIGAHFRTIVGGEAAGYTKLLIDSRNEARRRLMDEARLLGANAVVAMRFDCNEIGDIMTEIAAYGTAVSIVPLANDGDVSVVGNE